jgi:hypothetical protein
LAQIQYSSPQQLERTAPHHQQALSAVVPEALAGLRNLIKTPVGSLRKFNNKEG